MRTEKGRVSKPMMGTGAVSRFIGTAIEFKSEIGIEKDGKVGNAKSMMFVLTLMLDLGSEVTIRASGEDEDVAVKTLAEALGLLA